MSIHPMSLLSSPPVLNDGQNWQPHNVAVLTAALFIESVSAKIYRT
ncbi:MULTISPECIES: hypothetical protein [Proteus]|nr:hypothetical protein [Proteus terrae]MBG2839191.1 hypothetical protein [Proteus terrae subsp. cibarius]MBG2870354.1 hypothetical protein [Proteus terrae subsp. cibarius]